MRPQMLRTCPRGRQALAIGVHNLVQNNGKRNFFHKIGPIMTPKRIGYMISAIPLIRMCKRRDDQNWHS